MTHTPATPTAPAAPTADAAAALTPLGLEATSVTGGFWAPRQQRNGAAAIPSGLEQLERAGNLENLRRAARPANDPDHPGGLGGEAAIGPIFADSDVYKWLEAVAWEYARVRDRDDAERLLTMQREVTAIIAAAQCPDGYLNSVVTLRHGVTGRYTDLPWSHEHYCAGHLIQAAVAQVRCTGDTGMLDVAVRLADHLVATFGPADGGRLAEIDGHPVIEMALVELHRETGTVAYLELATWFVHARGHGVIANHGKDPAYFSDRVPVLEQTGIEGHAVRAVYLGAGAADVATEQRDPALLAALERQFATMWATKTYLTGGLGARWEGEAFGEPFELPNERAYAETCAAIGGIQWAWRLLLATGRAIYADAIERMLFNAFLAGVSLAGTEYFYVNPLRLRGGSLADEGRTPAHGRRGWFACACCPPNIMRTLASLDSLLATRTREGLQLHQYAPATVTDGDRALTVATDYPWDGSIMITVVRTAAEPWTLRLRVPGWAHGATIHVAEESVPAWAGEYAEITRLWQAGDRVELVLPMTPRLVAADPRIDAVRGCVAVERGPLVYAVEQVDQPAGVPVDDLGVVPDSAPADAPTDGRAEGLSDVVAVRVPGRVVPRQAAPWPYADDRSGAAEAWSAETVDVTAIPYYAWGNRGVEAMRVWLPVTAS